MKKKPFRFVKYTYVTEKGYFKKWCSLDSISH
jgi:hypothetical protein